MGCLAPPKLHEMHHSLCLDVFRTQFACNTFAMLPEELRAICFSLVMQLQFSNAYKQGGMFADLQIYRNEVHHMHVMCGQRT